MTTEDDPNDMVDAASSDAGAARPPSLLRARVDAWVLAVAMVVAFTGGFVFRGLDDGGSTSPAPAPAPVQADTPTLAPPLDEEQLEGGLPSDHPPIDEDAAPGDDTTASTAPGGASTTAPPSTSPPAPTESTTGN